MEHCKVKCSLCSVQQVWWGLRWGQQGLAGGFLWSCGFAGVWRFPEEETALGNHNAQSPASVRVVSPGHAMGQCRAKCSLCSVRQIGWGLHWGLQQGSAGGLWGCGFAGLWRFPEEEEAALGKHNAQSPASM